MINKQRREEKEGEWRLGRVVVTFIYSTNETRGHLVWLKAILCTAQENIGPNGHE